MACLVNGFQVFFGERFQTHKNANASGVGHQPHHFGIVSYRQGRLSDPTFAQRLERRKQPLGIIAIGRQVVVDEDEHAAGQLTYFGDYFLDRSLALCALTEGSYRAEITAVRTSSSSLDGVNRCVSVITQQVTWRFLQPGQRWRLFVSIDPVKASTRNISQHFLPHAFRFADDDSIGMTNRLVRA